MLTIPENPRNFVNAISKYFADKGMGSYFLNTIDVVWEELDQIEKQMVKSFKEGKLGNCLIHSRTLLQSELDHELEQTPHINL